MTNMDLTGVVSDGGMDSYMYAALLLAPYILFVVAMYVLIHGLVRRWGTGSAAPFDRVLGNISWTLISVATFAVLWNISEGFIFQTRAMADAETMLGMICLSLGHEIRHYACDFLMFSICRAGLRALHGAKAKSGQVPNHAKQDTTHEFADPDR